jgi:RimJ/RimL family protein N-acetyltransferase
VLPAVRAALLVELREVLPSDLPIHFEQQLDPDSSQMAAVAARDRPSFDEHWAKNLVDPTNVIRTVLVDGEVAGSALSFLRDGERQVGYWIAREHWGRGIASAALAQLLEELPERPLFATVAADNLGSRRVLEKCGFETIGEQLDGDVRLLAMRLG